MAYPDDKVKSIESKSEYYEKYLGFFNEFRRLEYDEELSSDLAREAVRFSIAADITNLDDYTTQLIDEFNKIGCTSFQMTPEELKKIRGDFDRKHTVYEDAEYGVEEATQAIVDDGYAETLEML